MSSTCAVLADPAAGIVAVSNHSAGGYSLGPGGHARLFARHDETSARVAADLKQRLAGA